MLTIALALLPALLPTLPATAQGTGPAQGQTEPQPQPTPPGGPPAPPTAQLQDGRPKEDPGGGATNTAPGVNSSLPLPPKDQADPAPRR